MFAADYSRWSNRNDACPTFRGTGASLKAFRAREGASEGVANRPAEEPGIIGGTYERPTDALSGRLAARHHQRQAQGIRARTGAHHRAQLADSGAGGDGICGTAAPCEPGGRPAVITSKLEKRYLGAVTASGAAVGSAALLPGIGTLAALSAAAGETAVFLEATAFFALAIAAVHGVPAENRELRRALVLAVLVGDDSKHAIGELLGPGRRSGAWLSEGAASLPMPALAQLNSRLLKRAVRRYHAATQCAAVRQDAADRHRRHHRRDRQPVGG